MRFADAKPEHITLASKVWIGCFSVLTFLVLVLGRLTVGAYDFERCPDLQRGDPLTKLPDGTPVFPDSLGDAECLQAPLVPVPLMATVDFGWFACLVLTTAFLPRSGSIYFTLKLVQPGTKPAWGAPPPAAADDDGSPAAEGSAPGGAHDLSC